MEGASHQFAAERNAEMRRTRGFTLLELLSVIEHYGVSLDIDMSSARRRAEEFTALGFGPADAAHFAFAEAGNAYFISCDDRLLKKCRKHSIKVWSGSPVLFCTEEELK